MLDDSTDQKRAYHCRRHELSTEAGCLLWGHRVIIPYSLRDDVLSLLHSTHMGMSAMKNLARNYVWWPKLDSDIEELVRHCETCQLNQRMPKKCIPHPWRQSHNPWDRIHLDFAGPFMNHMWMLVIDAYSKWIEVVNMRSNTKSGNVIDKLRNIFSRYGLPKILVSDNGPQLISEEFEEFCVRNGINHIPIPSYHPSSNGQVESIVGKFKAAMTKMQTSNKDIGLNLANWLVNYHNTPHSSTGIEPSVRMLGRRVRSALSLVHPFSCSRQITAEVKQEQKVLDGEKQLRRFEVGDPILYRDVLHKMWKKGTVAEVSDVQYGVTTESGSVVMKHIDHVVAYHSGNVANPNQGNSGEWRGIPETADRHEFRENVQPARPSIDLSTPPVSCNNPTSTSITRKGSIVLDNAPKIKVNSEPALPKPVEHDRPKRESKMPDRLNYEKLGGY